MKPQLTLRDLFWLVLVCGMAVGWWLTYRNAIEAREETDRLRTISDTLLERMKQVDEMQRAESGSTYSGTITEFIPNESP